MSTDWTLVTFVARFADEMDVVEGLLDALAEDAPDARELLALRRCASSSFSLASAACDLASRSSRSSLSSSAPPASSSSAEMCCAVSASSGTSPATRATSCSVDETVIACERPADEIVTAVAAPPSDDDCTVCGEDDVVDTVGIVNDETDVIFTADNLR